MDLVVLSLLLTSLELGVSWVHWLPTSWLDAVSGLWYGSNVGELSSLGQYICFWSTTIWVFMQRWLALSFFCFTRAGSWECLRWIGGILVWRCQRDWLCSKTEEPSLPLRVYRLWPHFSVWSLVEWIFVLVSHHVLLLSTDLTNAGDKRTQEEGDSRL